MVTSFNVEADGPDYIDIMGIPTRVDGGSLVPVPEHGEELPDGFLAALGRHQQLLLEMSQMRLGRNGSESSNDL